MTTGVHNKTQKDFTERFLKLQNAHRWVLVQNSPTFILVHWNSHKWHLDLPRFQTVNFVIMYLNDNWQWVNNLIRTVWKRGSWTYERHNAINCVHRWIWRSNLLSLSYLYLWTSANFPVHSYPYWSLFLRDQIQLPVAKRLFSVCNYVVK